MALALWLVLPLAYPLSAGPALYAVNRGWTPSGSRDALNGWFTVYDPAKSILSATPLGEAYGDYLYWWGMQGDTDAGHGD